MSNPSLFDVNFPIGLQAMEVKTSLVAWGVYLAGMTCYCILHQAIVRAVSPDVPATVTLAVREWGIWLLTTPIAFKALRQYEGLAKRPLASYLRLGVFIVLGSLAFPVLIDQLTATRSVASSIVIFLPRYLAALVVVYLVWHVFLRSKESSGGTHMQAPETAAVAPPPYPETLLVSKGRDESLIKVDRVQFISAAGNYVDIHADNQTYLMRATMKQVEELLPPPKFIRVHRSHIVNGEEIDRIKTQPSGNGSVRLRCGKEVSMSKKYKSRLYRVGGIGVTGRSQDC